MAQAGIGDSLLSEHAALCFLFIRNNPLTQPCHSFESIFPHPYGTELEVMLTAEEIELQKEALKEEPKSSE
jgi:hypothetical protein